MSRFVSAGSDGQETSERDEAWLKAQQQIEATKQKKAIAGQQEGGKSLYETLQANKAAKQESFEEASRLRNQFQSLDEDDVSFLDSVREQSRSKEVEMRKETREQLDAFRKQQEEAEKAARQEEGVETSAPAESWAVGARKRKKGREKEAIGGLKVRRVSTADGKDNDVPGAAAPSPEDRKVVSQAESKEAQKETKRAASPEASVQTPEARPVGLPGLGLGAYSSDEES